MKNINLKKSFVFVVLIILIGSFIFNNFFSKELINDYYTYINKDILDEMEIEEGEVGWSKFSLAQDNVDSDVEDIIKELINDKENSNLNIFYNSIIDIDTRNKNGLGILDNYIKLIDNSKDIDQFINNAIIVENELMIDIFTRSTIAPDFKDNSKTIVYFYPVTFDFGSSSDIYIDEDYSRYHALVKQYQIKLLKLYGYDKDKARSISSNLDKFFIDVSNKSKTSNELNDVDSLYNVVTKDELQDIYTNIDIDNYLNKMGISNQEYFSIVDSENYKVMNSYLTNENLSLLKEYVKVKILENYARYLSVDYANTINELNNKLMGIESNYLVEEEAIDLINSYFSNEVDKIYLEKYFSDEDKVFIDNMVKDILNCYEDNINSISWMSSDTKEKAILKLKNMKINIGGSYSESINYNLTSGVLLNNVIKMNKAISNYQLDLLDSNNYDTVISPTVVNAYYNPLDNSINFPASLKELYSKDDNYYSVLGSMGMIIAHEVTHAFDNNGSKFDEVGNRVDWWSKEDYSNFEKLQEEVISYYSNFEVNGLHVNGELTVGENIADLGALNCIVSIAEEKKANESELKELFTSYASLWASEYVSSYEKLLLLSDTHSPNKIRVNAVLSSIDSFYEIYNISNKDLMYIDKENRVGIW